MHILYVSDMDVKYGAPQAQRQMVEGFRKNHIEVKITVALPIGIHSRKEFMERANEYRALGCEIVCIRYGACKIPKQKNIIGKVKAYLKWIFGLTWGVKSLASRIEMDKIDIIHSNSSREDFGAAIAEKYHKPLVWHIREFGDLDYQVLTFRKNYIEYMNQHAALCITISNVLREHWIHKGLKAEKIKTIYDGVDERIIPKREYASNFDRKLRLVLLGSVQEAKGQDRLIEALGLIEKDSLKRLSVDIVGGCPEPDYMTQLQKRMEDLELTQTVHFLGYQVNFRERLLEYDCGLMCSRSEAFGLVTVEYMAAGLPVIAVATGANPEIIRDGDIGFLYDPGSSKNLADKIELLIRHPEFCEQMGRRATRYVQERFSTRTCVEQINCEYVKLSEELRGGMMNTK